MAGRSSQCGATTITGEDVHEEADWLKDVWYALREPSLKAPETAAARSWPPPPRELTLYGQPDDDVGLENPECYTAISI